MNINNELNLRMTTLIAILAVAFFLRIYKLETYPSQIHVDELSNIYDGYSIAETGADRWGMRYPVILRAFGESDYRPPMYSWLSAISIKVFGYSVFSGRLPSVIFGVLSLLLLYMTAKKIGGNLFAYLSLLLGTLSPWHIIFSRLALEAAMLPEFFVILTLYLFIRLKESNFKMIDLVCLSFCIGLATNAYQSTKLVFFLIAIIIFVEVLKNSRYKLKSATIFVLLVAAGASPQLFAAIAMPEHFFSRATGTIMPFSFSLEYIWVVLKNFYMNLSPQYLFLNFGSYNNLTIARLLIVELSFFYIGLVFLYKEFKKNGTFSSFYIYLFIFLSILPSALTFDNPHALRTSGNVILFPMISAGGMLFVFDLIDKKILRATSIAVLIGLIVYNSTSNILNYTKNPELVSAGQQNLLVQLGLKINLYKDKYSKIYIEDMGNQPYIYIAYYCNMHPKQFQCSYKDVTKVGWDHFVRLDKYFFLSKEAIIYALNKNNRSTLWILKKKDSNYNLIDSVGIHGEKLFFYAHE